MPTRTTTKNKRKNSEVCKVRGCGEPVKIKCRQLCVNCAGWVYRWAAVLRADPDRWDPYTQRIDKAQARVDTAHDDLDEVKDAAA